MSRPTCPACLLPLGKGLAVYAAYLREDGKESEHGWGWVHADCARIPYEEKERE